MRIYVNQAGYLPESKKTVLLAEAAEEGRGGTVSGRHSVCIPVFPGDFCRKPEYSGEWKRDAGHSE